MARKSKVKVALIQFPCIEGEFHRNYKTLQTLLKKVKYPVDLLVLPEMWPSSFDLKDSQRSMHQTHEILQLLKAFAQEKKVYVIGSHLEADPKGYYNTATVIDRLGRSIGKYQKVHLFEPDGEHKKFVAGSASSVVQTDIGKLGLAICYDIRFPELIRKETLEGAQILVVPSAWPRSRIDHYLSLLKVRAIENLIFVVSANKVGKTGAGDLYGGNSVAFGPWGKMLGKLGVRPGILEVTLDLGELLRIRRSFPVLKARREEVYYYKNS